MFTVVKKTPEDALAFLLRCKMTKDIYCEMRRASAESNANIWPSYAKVLESKKRCRPDGIIFEELSVYVPLQQLLDHTAKRILDQVESSMNYHTMSDLHYLL